MRGFLDWWQMRTVAINLKSGAMTIHLIFTVPCHHIVGLELCHQAALVHDSVATVRQFRARFNAPSYLNLENFRKCILGGEWRNKKTEQE